MTTPYHLQRFEDLMDRTSVINRLRGTYSLPEGFPRTKLFRAGQPPLEMPVVMLSAGDLTINSEGLVYSHNPKPRYAELRDLSFSTPIEHLEIALAQFDYAPVRWGNLPFISFRVRGLDVDPVLLTASGVGPFTFQIRRRTKRLFAAMVSAGATPLPSNNRWRGP